MTARTTRIMRRKRRRRRGGPERGGSQSIDWGITQLRFNQLFCYPHNTPFGSAGCWSPLLSLVLLIPSLPSGSLEYLIRRLSAPRRFRSDPELFLSSPHQCPAPSGALPDSAPEAPGQHRQIEGVPPAGARPLGCRRGVRSRCAGVRSLSGIANRQPAQRLPASPAPPYDFRREQSSPRLRATRTRFQGSV